jgi:Putative bacterial sensory transduction regulator
MGVRIVFDKQVTTKLIEKYLDRHGWHTHRSVDQPTGGLVLTSGTAPTGGQVNLGIALLNPQKALVFQVPNVLKAPLDETPADRLSGLLLMMGLLNYKTIVGKWAYDPSDGEVAFRAGVPIDEGGLTFEHFEHCLRAVTASLGDAPALQAILSGEKTADVAVEEERARVG